MGNQIEITDLAQGLKACLVETFESVMGIYLDKETSLFETLEQISAQQASQSHGGCATLAAHVEHIRYYLQVLEDRMFKRDLSYVNWGTIWETINTVTDDEWELMKTKLKETYERINGHLNNAETWEGQHEISAMFGIILHSAYHLGEIRQMMCRLQSEN